MTFGDLRALAPSCEPRFPLYLTTHAHVVCLQDCQPYAPDTRLVFDKRVNATALLCPTVTTQKGTHGHLLRWLLDGQPPRFRWRLHNTTTPGQWLDLNLYVKQVLDHRRIERFRGCRPSPIEQPWCEAPTTPTIARHLLAPLPLPLPLPLPQ